MKIHSIKFKISILYTLTLGMLLVSYSFFLYYSLHTDITQETDADLKEKAQEVIIFINSFYKDYANLIEDKTNALNKAIDLAIHMDIFMDEHLEYSGLKHKWFEHVDILDLSEDLLLFYNIGTKQANFTSNVTAEERNILLKDVEKHSVTQTLYGKYKTSTGTYRYIKEPFYFNGQLRSILIIATSQKSALSLLESRKTALIYSIPIVLLIAVLIGRFLANQLTRPLIQVAHTAEHISSKDLSQRVHTGYKDEEIQILTKSFNNMLDRIENSFSHITDFNSHVAHELKTPIAIIRGECEVALRKDLRIPEYKETLSVIFTEAEKMLKITIDLLLLAKLDYSPEVFKFERFDLKTFFNEILYKTNILAAEKRIHLSQKLPDSEITLMGDPVHLQRLFMNILANAVKFTPEDNEIKISVHSHDTELIVTISDTGIGIEPQDLDKVFNQFFQKVPLALPHSEGNGLGLSIAQAVAKVHRGLITVQSTVNQGSVFTITLPIVVISKNAELAAQSAG